MHENHLILPQSLRIDTASVREGPSGAKQGLNTSYNLSPREGTKIIVSPKPFSSTQIT